MSSKPNKKAGTSLGSVLSMASLKLAATKVSNYYRTQNYPGSPDAGLLGLTLDSVLPALREAVLHGGYAFQPLRTYLTEKPTGGVRVESMSSVLDRVLIQALFSRPGYAIQQILSQTASVHGYQAAPAYRFCSPGYRYMYTYWPGDYRTHRHNAVRMARSQRRGIVLHADISNFFPCISRERLRVVLRPWFSDETWPIVDRYLDFRVLRDGQIEPYGNGLPVEEPLSRLLAAVYLHSLDRFILHDAVIPYSRYMDDLFFVLPDEMSARRWLTRLEGFMATRLGLYMNHKKVEYKAAADFLKAPDVFFSRKLSTLETNLKLLPFQPAMRDGLIATLGDMVRDLPGLNAEYVETTKLRVRGAKFAAWRLAKVKAKGVERELELLLRDPRTRKIAAIGLSALGTKAATRALSRWLNEEGLSLPILDRVNAAGAFLRNGHNELLDKIHRSEEDPAELLAITRQHSRNLAEVKSSLKHTDTLVRRAAAVDIAINRPGLRSLLPALHQAIRQEADRDTQIGLLSALSTFSGSRATVRLLMEYSNHPDLLIAAFSRTIAGKINQKRAKAENKTEEPTPCHP